MKCPECKSNVYMVFRISDSIFEIKDNDSILDITKNSDKKSYLEFICSKNEKHKIESLPNYKERIKNIGNEFLKRYCNIDDENIYFQDEME